MPLEELTDLKDRLHHFVKSAGPKESPALPRKNSEAGFLSLSLSSIDADSGETAGGARKSCCAGRSPSLPTATSRPASASPALTVIAPALGNAIFKRLRRSRARAAADYGGGDEGLKGCPKLRCETIRRGKLPGGFCATCIARTPNGKISASTKRYIRENPRNSIHMLSSRCWPLSRKSVLCNAK